jgi:hypothetical protein
MVVFDVVVIFVTVLRAYTLSHSTSPFLGWVFSRKDL